MRETTLAVAARSLSGPMLTDLAQLLGSSPSSSEGSEPREDDEFIRAVWQEVGDDLRDAMRRYPLH